MQHYVIGSAQSPNINPEHRPNSWVLEWRPPAWGSLYLMSELWNYSGGGGRHRECCVGLFQAHKWRTRKVCWLTEIVVAPRGSAGWLVGNDLSLAGSISSCQSWRGLPPIAPVVRGVERTGRGWSTPAGGQTNREGHDVVLGAIHLTKQEGNNSRVHQFMFK